MIALALTLALLAPQDSWELAGEVQGASLHVAKLRADGDLHYVKARVSSPKSPRAVVATITLNCSDGTAEYTGEMVIYMNGQLSESRPYPDGIGGFKPVAADPLSGPVAAYACPK